MKYKKIVQEHPMGCAVACVASLVGRNYKKALQLFNKNKASTKGYFCNEITKALKKRNLTYSYAKANKNTKKHLKISGTMIFIKKSRKYPDGHYLVKTENGWTNPWINYPKINLAKAGFQKKLPGKAQWILFRTKKI